MKTLSKADLAKIAKMRVKAEKNLAYAQKQLAKSEPGSPLHSMAEAAVAQSQRLLATLATAGPE